MSGMNRRQFLKVGLSGLAYFTIEQTTPRWIMRAANAVPLDCLTDNRILVILQQSGGNDGLNTLIPYTDSAYYSARPTIGLQSSEIITLDGLNGLHPSMTGIANWFQHGNAAAINCVGYVNPDFSHFTSTDYWETGAVPGQVIPPQGWVARFYDNTCNGHGDPEPLFMASTGISNVPDMLGGSTNYVPPSIQSASSYALTVNNSSSPTATDRAARTAAIHSMNSMVPPNPEIEFLQRSVNSVEASTADIATANAIAELYPGSYTNDSLGNGLKLASKIIRAGFKTRIFYVSQGGYDTHANQTGGGGTSADRTTVGDHQKLLGNLSVNVDTFLKEMKDTGNLDRVLILTFSEFGRRIKENGSTGTDHGAANVVFAFGGGVNSGIYGGQPDLVNTINSGNIRHRVDFRTVYSAVIENWFRASAAPVFGQSAYDTVIAPGMQSVQFVKANASVKNWSRY